MLLFFRREANARYLPPASTRFRFAAGLPPFDMDEHAFSFLHYLLLSPSPRRYFAAIFSPASSSAAAANSRRFRYAAAAAID
jgi:hypothetical protein